VSHDSPNATLQRAFRTRQTVGRVAMGFGGILALVDLLARRNVVPQLHPAIDLPLWVATVLFIVWAWRCPACGGGIKLDGRTCSRCGTSAAVGTRP